VGARKQIATSLCSHIYWRAQVVVLGDVKARMYEQQDFSVYFMEGTTSVIKTNCTCNLYIFQPDVSFKHSFSTLPATALWFPTAEHRDQQGCSNTHNSLSVCLPACLSVYLPACLPVCLSIYLSIFLICLSNLSIYLFNLSI